MSKHSKNKQANFDEASLLMQHLIALKTAEALQAQAALDLRFHELVGIGMSRIVEGWTSEEVIEHLEKLDAAGKLNGVIEAVEVKVPRSGGKKRKGAKKASPRARSVGIDKVIAKALGILRRAKAPVMSRDLYARLSEELGVEHWELKEPMKRLRRREDVLVEGTRGGAQYQAIAKVTKIGKRKAS